MATSPSASGVPAPIPSIPALVVQSSAYSPLPAQSEAVEKEVQPVLKKRRTTALKQRRKSTGGDGSKFPYDYYHQDKTDGTRRCKYCTQVYGAKTSITVLKNHSINKHRKKDPNKKRKVKSTDSENPSRSTPLHPRFGSSNPLPKAPLSQEKNNMLNDEVVRFIVCSKHKQPHSVSEDPSFRRLIQKCSGEEDYVPIGRHTVHNRIKELFKNMIPRLITYLAAVSGRFSVAFDGWSDPNMQGYYSVTLHWFCDKTQRMKSLILDFFFVEPGQGVSTRCADRLFEFLVELRISDRIIATVSDNGSGAMAAATKLSQHIADKHEKQLLRQDHIVSCSVHTLQLAVRPVVELTRKPLSIFRDFIERVQNTNKLRRAWRSKAGTEPPSLDTPTRWGSAHTFLKQCFKNKEVLEHVNDVASKPTDGNVVTLDGVKPKDWAILKATNTFLEKPSKISDMLGSDRQSTIGMVAKGRKKLMQHGTTTVQNEHALSEIRDGARKLVEVLKRSEHQLCVVHRIGTFLDPRFRGSFGTPRQQVLDEDKDVVRARLMSDYSYQQPNRPGALLQRRPMPEGFSDDEDETVADRLEPSEDVEDEIDMYLKKPTLRDGTMDPFAWWAQHEHEMPTLTRMARDYLAIPSSSLGLERANSVTRLHWEDRGRMSDDVFRAELCLSSWYKAGIDEIEPAEHEYQ